MMDDAFPPPAPPLDIHISNSINGWAVVPHTFDSSTWEAEAGIDLREFKASLILQNLVPEQPRLHRKPYLEKTNKNKQKEFKAILGYRLRHGTKLGNST